MRHKKAGVKLHRTTSHRQAMFRNMVTSLFKHDRIRTTDVKAKELRRWADQIITLAKRGDLHARRQVLAIVREKDVVHKLFAEVQERFGDIKGGYTRIVKIGHRPGDAAPVSLIELVATDEKVLKGKKKAKPAEKKKPSAPVVTTPKETQGETQQAAPEAEATADTATAEVDEAVDSHTAEAEASPEEAAPQTAEQSADADEEPTSGAGEDAPKKE